MKSKVTFNKSGAGSVSGRVTIPRAFLEILGVTKEENEIKITMQGEKIIIEKGEIEMNKFYNGAEVNMENLKKVLADDNTTGDMTQKEIDTIKSFVQYDSEEDMEYLLQKLQEKKGGGYVHNEINWQIIYDIISQGEWNYNS